MECASSINSSDWEKDLENAAAFIVINEKKKKSCIFFHYIQ